MDRRDCIQFCKLQVDLTKEKYHPSHPNSIVRNSRLLIAAPSPPPHGAAPCRYNAKNLKHLAWTRCAKSGKALGGVPPPYTVPAFRAAHRPTVRALGCFRPTQRLSHGAHRLGSPHRRRGHHRGL